MKVTTTPKDFVKVNTILPIMQEHFGNHTNLARIKLMALLPHALCVVQTVSLHKLAAAMPTSLDRDSNLRRLQRFIHCMPTAVIPAEYSSRSMTSQAASANIRSILCLAFSSGVIVIF